MADMPATPARQDAADNGLGVPPFRPAHGPQGHTQGHSQGVVSVTPIAANAAKEAPMARPPYATPPGNPPMPTSATTPRPVGPVATRPLNRDTHERRTLVVGRGISVQGTVTDAERLVVEGQVEASMIHATELAVSPGGVFKGEVEVEDAEIAGTLDGTVTARGNLSVRSTGVVLGTARCRRLQVEDGGQITGRIEMITEAKPKPVEQKVHAEA